MNNLLTSFFFVESIFWKHIFVKYLTIKLSIINYIIVNNKIVYKKIFYYRIFDAVFQKFSLINIFNTSIYKYIYRWALFTLFVHFALFHIFPKGENSERWNEEKSIDRQNFERNWKARKSTYFLGIYFPVFNATTTNNCTEGTKYNTVDCISNKLHWDLK